MKKENTYLQIIRQLAFVVIVLIIVAKPLLSLVNHLSSNNDDIELVEDFDEEDSEEEIEYNENIFYSNAYILSTKIGINQNNTSLYVINQYIDVYKDILTPPPKFQC